MSTKSKRQSDGNKKKSSSDPLQQTSLLRYTTTKASTPHAVSTTGSSASKAKAGKLSHGKRRTHVQKENIIPSLEITSLSRFDAPTQPDLANSNISNMSPGGNSSSSQSSSIPGLYPPETPNEQDSTPRGYSGSVATSTATRTLPSTNSSQGPRKAKRKAADLNTEIIDLSDSDEEHKEEISPISRPYKRLRKTFSPRPITDTFHLSSVSHTSPRRGSHTITPRSHINSHTPVPRSSSVVSSSTNDHYSPFKPLFDDVDLQSGDIIESSQSQNLQDFGLVQSSQSQYLSPLRLTPHEDSVATLNSSNKHPQKEDAVFPAPPPSTSPHRPSSYGVDLLSLSQRPPTPPIITAPGEKIRRRRPGKYSLQNTGSITLSANGTTPSVARDSSLLLLDEGDGPEPAQADMHQAVDSKRASHPTSTGLPDRSSDFEKRSGTKPPPKTETEPRDHRPLQPPSFRTDDDGNPFLDKSKNQDLPFLSLPLFQPFVPESQHKAPGNNARLQHEEPPPAQDADATLVSVPTPPTGRNSTRMLVSSNRQLTHQRQDSSEDPDRTLVSSSTAHRDSVKSLVRGMEHMSPFKSRVRKDYEDDNNEMSSFHQPALSPSPSKFESQLPFEESIPVMSIPHGWGESQLASMDQVPDYECSNANPQDRVEGAEGMALFGGNTTPERHADDIEQDQDWPSAVKRFEQQPSPYAGMFSGSIEDSSEEETPI